MQIYSWTAWILNVILFLSLLFIIWIFLHWVEQHCDVFCNSLFVCITTSRSTEAATSSNKSLPELSSSKQANAFLMTSSGSVPLSFSPNIVRNIVKFMGPGASFIISSKYASVGFFPVTFSLTIFNSKRNGLGGLKCWRMVSPVPYQ